MICGICFSQNTGYMGKHFILNAEGGLSPSWFNPNPLTTHLIEHYVGKDLHYLIELIVLLLLLFVLVVQVEYIAELN